MVNKIEDIFKMCESTPAWYGEKISSVSSRNAMGDTPLHTACSWGEIEPVEILILSGADINSHGDVGATPLFRAVDSESSELVDWLLEKGARVDVQTDYGHSLLEYAKNTDTPKRIIYALQKKKNKGTP
jgi:ankyrin repeat protein